MFSTLALQSAGDLPETDAGAHGALDAVAWPDLAISRLESTVLHEPISTPVRGAFGAMAHRNSLVVRVRLRCGVEGYGEVWSNFPAGGAEYKQTLLHTYCAAALEGQVLRHPQDAHALLARRLHRLTLQSGDFGSMAQVCAGVDQAVWDACARLQGRAFWQMAGGEPRVAVYASGIGPDDIGETIRREAAAGHTRFKIKMGFGERADHANLVEALDALTPGGVLMVDANQAWSLEQAADWLPVLEEAGVLWCEEPMPADAPFADWQALSRIATRLRLAAGENLRTLRAFEAAQANGIQVLQPDLGKWGGISENLRLPARLRNPATWICPHWLAGGVGLAASLQFKSAIGGGGFVEVDANPSILRTGMFDKAFSVDQGSIELSDAPGIVPRLNESIFGNAQWR